MNSKLPGFTTGRMFGSFPFVQPLLQCCTCKQKGVFEVYRWRFLLNEMGYTRLHCFPCLLLQRRETRTSVCFASSCFLSKAKQAPPLQKTHSEVMHFVISFSGLFLQLLPTCLVNFQFWCEKAILSGVSLGFDAFGYLFFLIREQSLTLEGQDDQIQADIIFISNNSDYEICFRFETSYRYVTDYSAQLLNYLNLFVHLKSVDFYLHANSDLLTFSDEQL